MKKLKVNLMMVLALVIGAIAMSFKVVNLNAESDTVWFEMNAAGTQVTSTQIENPDELCHNQDEPNCAREYLLSDTEPAPEGGIRVKASKVNDFIDFRGKN